MENEVIRETEKFAVEIRMQIIRQLSKLGFGHAGGCLSVADVIASLYGGIMDVDPKDPQKKERDRLVVSKGHAGPALYAALALKGFFPMEWLDTLNRGGTRLPSHCDGNKTPGIDCTTGSLGQGLSRAAGMAYGLKLDSLSNTVYAILGDGECQEGQIWEAALAAPKFGLDNLICFVDYNKIQLDGAVEEVMPLESLFMKFRSFGWHTQQVNGNDPASIFAAVELAKKEAGRPSAILLDTVKGYGCSEIAALGCLSHHMDMPEDLARRCMAELEEQMKQYE